MKIWGEVEVQQSEDCAASAVHPFKVYTHRNEIDTDFWNELLEHSAHTSYFQSPGCYELYASQSFMEEFVVAVGSEVRLEALVCGYIVREGKGLKGYLSRRAIVPGGVLIRSGAEAEAVEKVLAALNAQLDRTCIYTEFRNYSDYRSYSSCFERMGYRYEPHLNLRLDCHDRQQVWNGLSASKRRQIRQSQQAGLSIGKAENAEDISAFYRLLSELYRGKIRRPLFPESFFHALAERKDTVVLVCKYRGEVCGGIVCVLHAKVSVSEWFVCGDSGMEMKGIYPSVMATWGGIDYAIENGYALFDFMGAGKPDEPYGVRDFKMRFGGSLVEYGRFLYIRNSIVYLTGASFLHLLDMLLAISRKRTKKQLQAKQTAEAR